MAIVLTGFRDGPICTMKISEIYASRQGEGFLTGVQSVFVRTSGCNLRCHFCDSPFTSWNPEGKQLSVGELIHSIQQYRLRHVVLTGGEPFAARNVVELSHALRKRGYHLTIETAGTLFQDLPCNLMSISPKLANSTPSIEHAGSWSKRHEARRLQPSILQQLVNRYDYQLKFVVASPGDVDEIEDLLRLLPGVRRSRVLLMPEGVHSDELRRKEHWLRPLAESRGFVFCPRKHIEWYGNKRGT